MSKRFGFYGFLIFWSLIFGACKTTQPLKPKESYLKMKKESGISSINIPVQLDLKELEKTINRELSNLEYEDDISGKDISVKAKKKGEIQISVGENNIAYNVPVYLWIKKETMLGAIEAEGEIELAFQTKYSIDENWHLSTTTEVVNYSWNKKPVLKLGFVNIPISFVANWILNRSKEQICGAIDQQIQENFNLHDYITRAWDILQEPILASEEYNVWIKLSPQTVEMSSIVAKGEMLASTIYMEAGSDIVLGEKPVVIKSTQLPPFQIGTNERKDFLISLKVDIEYKTAAAIAKKHLIGERFSSGKYAVVIEDIDLYGQGNKLVVNAKLSGTYNGSIYLVGKPIYNSATNTIELEELNYELNTKNFLIKSLSWLFHKGIKRKMKAQLKFPLQENLKELKQQIQKQLKHYEIQKDIVLQGHLDELDIARTYLTTDAIQVIIASTGQLKLQIMGINKE